MTTTQNERLISFVVPFYNEGENVELFHAALTAVVGELDYACEFDYVNDGSTDDTLERLERLRREDARVTVINLAHNRGHQIAITAGLDHAPGEAVVVMDADLQDPPAVVPELIKAWEGGADVAYAQRRSRQDSTFKKVTADAYYRMLGAISDVEIPRNTGDFRLMNRRVVDELCRYREHDRYMRGIVASLGFKQVAVPFDRDERRIGETHYTLPKMMKLAADGVLGFSTAPLTAITRVGAGVATLGVAGLGAAGVARATASRPQRRWDSLRSRAGRNPGHSNDAVAVAFAGTAVLSGVQMIMIGTLGAYVGRIYRGVQNRPLYGIERVDVARARRLPADVTLAHAA